MSAPSIDAAHLRALPEHMRYRDIRTRQLYRLTGIPEERIKELKRPGFEPFLDEAYTIHRALCTSGILPLITSTASSLHDITLGVPMPSDVDKLRVGERLTLSLACRICVRVGLSDPAQLIANELHQELWAMMTRERSASCPWCHAACRDGAPHASTCLPDILWGPRNLTIETGAPHRPLRPGVGRQSSGLAHGLRNERLMRKLPARGVAEAAHMRPDYYSKLERLHVPLTVDRAHAISRVLMCDVARLYAVPADPIVL